jgi:hypothetical protein
MNCLEFRRLLGSEPASTLSAFVTHRGECPSCAAAQQRADEFELRIRRAASVPVPVNLADRILLAQTTQSRHGSRNRRRGFAALVLAAAASIVVAVIAVRQSEQQMPALAGMVIEHLHEHPISSAASASTVTSQSVMDAFAARGVTLTSVPEGINYVHQCPAGPYRSVHMVMPERDGPVSVVYVVDKASARRVDFTEDGMHGREVPLGAGSLVMIARVDADFDAIESAWKSAMDERVALAGMSLHGPGSGGAPAILRTYGAAIAAP